MISAVEVRLSGNDFPTRVLDLVKRPEVLFLRGTIPDAPKVAIVGARRCTDRAREYTLALARDLAEAGIAVLSGGALGIDTAAHEGALEGKGRTVVVAPGGFGRPYPARNAQLFRRILETGSGAYLSVAAEEQPATRPSFFIRNGVMVALADAVVLVEANYRSGARNAAAQARALGRPLLVVPHAPWSRRGTGCVEELKRGATPIRNARDVIRALGRVAEPAPVRPEVQPRPRRHGTSAPTQQRTLEFDREPLPSDQARVLHLVGRVSTTFDSIAGRAELSVGECQRILLMLQLSGWVRRDGAGGWLRV